MIEIFPEMLYDFPDEDNSNLEYDIFGVNSISIFVFLVSVYSSNCLFCLRTSKMLSLGV